VTEADWLGSTDPAAMLSFLLSYRVGTGRKYRLVAVACARRAWPQIDDPGRAAVEAAELFADCRADAEQLRAARLACKGSGPHSSWYAAATDPTIAARNAALSAQDGATDPQTERLAQADLLRDIVGNPFRPMVFDPWRTPEVVRLARAMYARGDFTRLPELADALQRAGCTDDHVLGHCRGGTEHRKGCWVVDSVLSKT